MSSEKPPETALASTSAGDSPVVFAAEEEIFVERELEDEATSPPESLTTPERGDVETAIVPSLTESASDHEMPLIANFKDHFSLPMPSSRIRFRSTRSAARVIEQEDGQFVLEENYDSDEDEHEVSIKRIEDKSAGVSFLRAIYAVVTAFWTGFLLIFSLQILLFLTLDLAIQLGITSKQDPNYGAALGVLCSFPAFVYGLASALVIAGAFISDVWRGHFLIRNFAFRKLKSTAVEWIFFTFFLGLPLFVMGCLMLEANENWWVIGGSIWFFSIFAFFVIFCFNVIFFEIHACRKVMRLQYTDDTDHSCFHVTLKALMLRQVARYSAIKYVSFLSRGALLNSEATDKLGEENMLVETRTESLSLLAKLTMWKRLSTNGGLGLYEDIQDSPQQVYTIDDARDVRPFMTAQSWSLEKVFCRPKHSRYIMILSGAGAVTRAQLRSSFACSVIGSFLMFFLLLSFLVYLDMGYALVGFGIAIGIIVALPSFISTFKLYRTGKDLIFAKRAARKSAPKRDKSIDRNDDLQHIDSFRRSNQASEAVYFVRENFRVTRATPRLCWIMFVLEVAFGGIWPLWSLLAVNNLPLALMFILISVVTGLRYYFNAAIVLEETGNLDMIDDQQKNLSDRAKWREASRLSAIIGNITRGRSRGPWMAVLGVFGFIVVGLFAGALGTEQVVNAETTSKTSYVYLPDFHYEQQDSLQYPTCQLSNDLGLSPLTKMVDYAYLAGVAYRDVGATQAELDGWFNGTALDNNALVKKYRAAVNLTSEVSFKLITFPDKGNFAFVSIRGTQNNWDMLTDVQLWSAAKLMQVLREALPFGSIWTPIIPTLIKAITKLESGNIQKISFYKDTTAFVETLLELVPANFSGVAVTGHSLGGGLSIITGAQTGVPAVGLSAPNAMLSRKSFEPPITVQALNSKTFNIIPDRDVVPQIDDPAQNFQNINCNTATQDILACHDSTRSLCEIMFTCGTGPRPAICQCVTDYGYPEPRPYEWANRTFAEACASAMEGK
ncbi:hypothetical protein MPSEU_001017600 [Mayamaea pseudoterrestris]|nr:hypothetical protein MPSEU_001017600 [Mayamaea pseudoterrestris]